MGGIPVAGKAESHPVAPQKIARRIAKAIISMRSRCDCGKRRYGLGLGGATGADELAAVTGEP